MAMEFWKASSSSSFLLSKPRRRSKAIHEGWFSIGSGLVSLSLMWAVLVLIELGPALVQAENEDTIGAVAIGLSEDMSHVSEADLLDVGEDLFLETEPEILQEEEKIGKNKLRTREESRSTEAAIEREKKKNRGREGAVSKELQGAKSADSTAPRRRSKKQEKGLPNQEQATIKRHSRKRGPEENPETVIEASFSEELMPDAQPDLVNSNVKSSAAAESEVEGEKKTSDEKAEPVVEEDVEIPKDLIAEYSLGEPITDWDRKRQLWLEEHPQVKPVTDDGKMRLLILTGTQPGPCATEQGDHLYLRCFKNKVDYCRIHGIEIFYNIALLDPNMPTFWAKLPLVRASMLSHPEAEWIWWLDADALITDMEFEVPLEKYNNYNLVVHGWESLVYEKRHWLGLNAGSFLIRNCQWSMDFMERWAAMGPQGPLGEASRDILSDFLPDRVDRNPTDDQSALVYLMIKEREKWAGKIHIELEYFLNGYWLELVGGFEKLEEKYREMERSEQDVAEMEGERQAEKMVREAGRVRQKHLKNTGLFDKRPFVTHFTGCSPCSGHHNPIYSKDACDGGMIRALNYADDQVLRSFGYKHTRLEVSDVKPFE